MVENFLAYVSGIDGQQALEESSFYTHFARPFDIDVEFPEPFFHIPQSGPRRICKGA